jgi:hypothetical protein
MMTGYASRLLFGALLVLVAAVGHARIEPAGVWSCVLYGQDSENDERMLLELRVDGATYIAELGEPRPAWVPMSYWSQRRGYLSFTDTRHGREFQADLEYTTLGGIWIGEQFSGGWWCAPLDERPELSPQARSFNEYSVMPRLIVDSMATPWYPKTAILRPRIRAACARCDTSLSLPRLGCSPAEQAGVQDL